MYESIRIIDFGEFMFWFSKVYTFYIERIDVSLNLEEIYSNELYICVVKPMKFEKSENHILLKRKLKYSKCMT